MLSAGTTKSVISFTSVENALFYRESTSHQTFKSDPLAKHIMTAGWLGSRMVSVLDSGAEGPGSNRSRDAVG